MSASPPGLFTIPPGDLLTAIRAVLGIVDRDVLAQRISEEAHRLLGREFTSVALRENDELLVMRGAHGARTRYVGLRVPIGAGIGGKVLVSGEPLSVSNYLEDPRCQEFHQVAEA